MTASTASWMTASSSATPRNAPTTAPSSSPISRTAWCAARPNCIRRINRRIACRRSPSASRRRVRRQGVGSILFRRLIAEARWKGYRTLRITTGAQNEAMRALANKFGAHLTFRHGESTGTIDLKPQPQPELAKLGDRDAGRCGARDGQLQPRLLEAAAANVWLGPDGLSDRVTNAFADRDRRIGRSACARIRSRCACRCRISGPRGVRPRPSAARPVRPRSRASSNARWCAPTFFTSACTDSIGSPISDAAISACAS